MLDDLLPESGKPRRSGGGRFFSKMKAGDHDDDDDEDDEVDALNREAEKREVEKLLASQRGERIKIYGYVRRLLLYGSHKIYTVKIMPVLAY